MKEAEKIVFPAFPNPENYRNWRLRAREALVAASDRTDKALEWLSTVWTTDKTVGSVYDVEDLPSVTMVNEKLEVFMRNWDAVLSGIKKPPDKTFLEPIFHRQIKKARVLQHDLNV